MASLYHHIVVAVDLTDESSHVIDQALPIAQRSGARLSIVHTPGAVNAAYGGDVAVDVDTLREELSEHSHTRLMKLAEPYGIASEQLHVLSGSPDAAIKAFASEQQVDLIVVGSHGRTGWALMLGSTTTDILRHAECDVLAVKVQGVDRAPAD